MDVSPGPAGAAVATARLLMVGHSHLGAFLRVFTPDPDDPSVEVPDGLHVEFVRVGKQRAIALTPGPDGPTSSILGGWREGAQTLASEVARLAGSMDADAVALAWRGNEMNVRGLFATGPAFDVILPGDLSPVTEGAELLPYTALAGYTRRWLDEDEGLRLVIDAVRSAGVERVLLLSPPPPRGDDDAVLARLPDDTFLAKRARSMGFEPHDVPLTPAPVRRRLWSVLVQVYRGYAQDHAITFLGSPAAAADDDGLLAVGYQADITHGNVRYGRLYLDAINCAIRR